MLLPITFSMYFCVKLIKAEYTIVSVLVNVTIVTCVFGKSDTCHSPTAIQLKQRPARNSPAPVWWRCGLNRNLLHSFSRPQAVKHKFRLVLDQR